jgi:hypothetical protein
MTTGGLDCTVLYCTTRHRQTAVSAPMSSCRRLSFQLPRRPRGRVCVRGLRTESGPACSFMRLRLRLPPSALGGTPAGDPSWWAVLGQKNTAHCPVYADTRDHPHSTPNLGQRQCVTQASSSMQVGRSTSYYVPGHSSWALTVCTRINAAIKAAMALPAECTLQYQYRQMRNEIDHVLERPNPFSWHRCMYGAPAASASCSSRHATVVLSSN